MAETDYLQRLKLGRNDPCGCGSGKKYKKCHLAADEKAQSEAMAKVNQEATEKAKADEKDHPHDHDHDHHGHDHAHKHEKGGPARPHTSINTSRQISAPRKTGSS